LPAASPPAFAPEAQQHRRPGDHTQLVTLCAGCHARVHRTLILRRWLPEILVDLWREWHPDASSSSGFPSKCPLEYRLERGGKAVPCN